MNGTRFMPQIIRTLNPGESPEDIGTMIDILGTERAAAVHGESEDADEFAAGIICVLLKPFKPPNYQQQMRALRFSFRGITASQKLQATFRSLFTPALLNAPNALAAINLGFHALFSLNNLTA